MVFGNIFRHCRLGAGLVLLVVMLVPGERGTPGQGETSGSHNQDYPIYHCSAPFFS
jgi:hypothetical protein